MTQVQISLNEAIDQATERLPFLRRRIAKRAFRRDPELKAEVADRIMVGAEKDERFEACCLGLCSGYASGSISASTSFGIDLDNLERFLQIIVEYLPKILEIVLKFIPLFVSVAVFACLIGLSSIASAQCDGNVCRKGDQDLLPHVVFENSDSPPTFVAAPIGVESSQITSTYVYSAPMPMVAPSLTLAPSLPVASVPIVAAPVVSVMEPVVFESSRQPMVAVAHTARAVGIGVRSRVRYRRMQCVKLGVGLVRIVFGGRR